MPRSLTFTRQVQLFSTELSVLLEQSLTQVNKNSKRAFNVLLKTLVEEYKHALTLSALRLLVLYLELLLRNTRKYHLREVLVYAFG